MEADITRKARGAFFTPAPIAKFLADWAVRSPHDTILEPSCGEAEFLVHAGARLRDFGESSQTRLFGAEIHASTARSAQQLLRSQGFSAEISHEDFFKFDPGRKFSAVIGNPPFVRYQNFSGEARSRSAEAALKQGVRLSGLASSWAAFVVHASLHLEDDGRLGLVLPAELLSVKYAAEVRSYLLKRFSSVKLVLFEDLVFPGVLEDVVLLMAEGQGGASSFDVFQTRNAETLAASSPQWTQHVPKVAEKWTPAILGRQAFETYEQLVKEFCEPLVCWGRTYLGSVTGSNRFFTLSAVEAAEAGLSERDLRKISPPGSRHLRGLTFSDAAWRNLSREGAKTYIFYPPDEPSAAAGRYISSGINVSNAYKCRVRTPWWKVPLVKVPDLFLTYMDHERPRLIENAANALILNSIYGVELDTARKELGRQLLPIAAINSVTLLGSEVVGRAYGGGLLKLEPREADRIPLPSLDLVQRKGPELAALKSRIASGMRQGRVQRVAEMVDAVLFDGIDLGGVRDAREVLFERRRLRGKYVKS